MECSRSDATLDAVVPGWCADCGHTVRVGAAALLDWLVPVGDPVRVAEEQDGTDGAGPDPLGWPDYDRLRARASADSGTDESVTVRRGEVVDVADAVVVAWDFGFLGGSMGTVAGRRIAAAYDHARREGLPVVLLPATGGARMQEGMASLVQMATTSAAAAAHRDAGLLQVAVLRDPTTGGVFASHANQADVVLAEPGATIGFAGPRVAEAVTDGPLPSGSHTAAGAHAAGLVDAVVARPDLPAVLGDLLRWSLAATGRHAVGADTAGPVDAGDPSSTAAPSTAAPAVPDDPWAEVERARAPGRRRARALLDQVEVLGELRGDRAGGTDPTIEVLLARWAGRPVVVLAMHPGGEQLGPAGYRTAWRGIDLAGRLGVPVVSLVDTPGADPSAAAEAGGVAHHIATTMRRLLDTPVPVVALVVGEGGSGGALALAVGDRLLVQEHAVFHVIAPEGAAAILHRDRDRAPEVARLLDPTAHRLHQLGVADEVVPEPEDSEVATAVAAVARHLDELTADDVAGHDRVAARRARWRDPLA